MTTENGLIITPVTGGETRSYVTNPNEWMGNVHAETNPVTGGISFYAGGSLFQVGVPRLASRPTKIVFLGDSITAGSNQVYPRTDYDCGGGLWDAITSSMTNHNAVSTFIVQCWPDSACVSTDSVTVAWDGLKNMTVAVAGDSAGAAVDVTGGGFFHLVSATNNKGVCVQIRWANKPATAKSDTGTATGTRSLYNATLNCWWYAGLARAGFSDAKVLNMGIGGDTASDMLARVAQVVAESPDAVFLHCGTNDIAQTAETASLIDYLVARVPLVVIVPVLPRGKNGAASAMTATDAKKQAAFWRYTKNYALGKNNCVIYDAWSTVVDPSVASGTGLVNAACFSTDFLHLSLYGSVAAIAPDFYTKVVSQLFQNMNQFTTSGGDIYDATYNPLGNLLGTAGAFIGTAGSIGTNTGGNAPSGSLATGWTDIDSVLGGHFVDVTYSQPARSDGYNGVVQRVVLATATGGAAGRRIRLSPNLTSTLAAGTKARARIAIRLTNTTLLSVLQALFKAAGSASTYAYIVSQVTAQTAGTITDSGMMYFTSHPFIVPASLGTCDFFIYLACASGGSATIDICDASVEAIPS